MKQNIVKLYLTLNNSIDKWLLCGIAFLLPFDFTPSIDVWMFRVKPSVLLIAVMALRVVYIVFFGNQFYRIKRLPKAFVIFYGLWILWYFLGFVVSVDKPAALKVFLPLLIYSIMLFSVVLLWRKEFVKIILKSIWAGALVACLFGIYQFVGNRFGLSQAWTGLRPDYSWEHFGFPRMQSVALEPLYFGAYLLLPISTLLTSMIKEKEIRKFKYVCLLSLFLLCDFLTLSRGAIIATVFSVFIVCLFTLKLKTLLSNKKILGVIVAVFVVIVVAVVGIISTVSRQGTDQDVTYGKTGLATLVEHLKNTHFFASNLNKTNDDSIGQRDSARSQAISLLKADKKLLLIGSGPGQYGAYAKKNIQKNPYGVPNNLLLEQLTQTGVVGLVLMLGWVGYIVAGLMKHIKQYWAVALLAYFAALFLQSQAFAGIGLTHLWFAVGLGVALINSTYAKYPTWSKIKAV